MDPLRTGTGITRGRLWNLAEGQATFAMIAPAGPAGPAEPLLLVEAGSHPEAVSLGKRYSAKAPRPLALKSPKTSSPG